MLLINKKNIKNTNLIKVLSFMSFWNIIYIIIDFKSIKMLTFNFH